MKLYQINDKFVIISIIIKDPNQNQTHASLTAARQSQQLVQQKMQRWHTPYDITKFKSKASQVPNVSLNPVSLNQNICFAKHVTKINKEGRKSCKVVRNIKCMHYVIIEPRILQGFNVWNTEAGPIATTSKAETGVEKIITLINLRIAGYMRSQA